MSKALSASATFEALEDRVSALELLPLSEPVAILRLTTIHPDMVFTAGYAVAGDGGGATYKRVTALPAHPGYFQDASGAYFVLVPDAIGANPRQFGAKGDGVQNATTGAWTGTDDTVAFQNMEQTAKALNCPRFIPQGSFLITSQITGALGYFSYGDDNAVWHGLGEASKVIIKANDPGSIAYMWAYGGVVDAITDVTVYPTSAISVGDYQITVNDTSSLLVNEWIELIDHSQDMIDNQTNAGVAKIGFPARIVSIDSSTTFSIDRRSEFALTANAGSPISATTVRRMSGMVKNITLENFTVEFDPTFTYTQTHRLFWFSNALNPTVRNITVRRSQWDELRFVECVGYNYSGYKSDRGNTPNEYLSYSMVATGSHHGKGENIIQIGGRHATDGSSISGAGLPAMYAEFSDLYATGSEGAPFQSHTGTYAWKFTDFYVDGISNDTLTTPTNPGSAAVQARGTKMSFRNYFIAGCVTGFYCVYGSDIEIGSGEIDGCRDAFNFLKCPRITVAGRVLVRNPINSVLTLQDTTTTLSAGWAVSGVEVIGNPATAVIVNNCSSNSSTWNFHIEAPSATTFVSGTAIASARLGFLGGSALHVGRTTDYTAGVRFELTPAVNNGNIKFSPVALPGGTATKAGFQYQSLGEGAHVFRINGYNALQIESYPSSVNYPSISPAPTGVNPFLHPIGGDTDVAMDIKGAGAKGGRLLAGDGTVKVETSTTGVGFNGTAAIAKPTLAAVATDAASTLTLANSIRTALINLGLGQ
jgi:hypothetical protein